jgi:hypothetical protein
MNAPRWIVTAFMVCALGGHCAVPTPAQSAGTKEIIRRANLSYDDFTKDGLIEFQCEVLPDWDSVYKSLKADGKMTVHDEILPFLRQTHFKVSVGHGGASTVSHESDAAPPNEQFAERIRMSTSGVDQLITGFFLVWGNFAFDPILPDAESQYELADLGDHYRLTFKQGNADVVILMGLDYAISQTTISTPQLNAVFHPQFYRTKKGYLLSGIEGLYTAPANTQRPFAMHIDYQEVEGFNLPSKVDSSTPFGGKMVHVQLAFTAYRIKKR